MAQDSYAKRIASQAVLRSLNEVNGKILTRPALDLTDGDGRTWCVDAEIVTDEMPYQLAEKLAGLLDMDRTLRFVPLARNSRDLIYAEAGNPCVLRRSANGSWEVAGLSREGPGDYVRFPVSLTDYTFGPMQDLTIQAKPLTYGELATFGGYGNLPYGATAIFIGGTFRELR